MTSSAPPSWTGSTTSRPRGLSETKYRANRETIQDEIARLGAASGQPVTLTGHSQGGADALRSAADARYLVDQVVTLQGAGTTSPAADMLTQAISDGDLSVTEYFNEADIVHTLGFHPEGGTNIGIDAGDDGIGAAHGRKDLLGDYSAGQDGRIPTRAASPGHKARDAGAHPSDGMHSEEIGRGLMRYGLEAHSLTPKGQLQALGMGAASSIDTLAGGSNSQDVDRHVDDMLGGFFGPVPQLIAMGLDPGSAVDQAASTGQRGTLLHAGNALGDLAADVTGEASTDVGRGARNDFERDQSRKIMARGRANGSSGGQVGWQDEDVWSRLDKAVAAAQVEAARAQGDSPDQAAAKTEQIRSAVKRIVDRSDAPEGHSVPVSVAAVAAESGLSEGEVRLYWR